MRGSERMSKTFILLFLISLFTIFDTLVLVFSKVVLVIPFIGKISVPIVFMIYVWSATEIFTGSWMWKKFGEWFGSKSL